MKKALITLAAMLVGTFASAANEDTRFYEMRTYYAPAGKLDALHARFRDHTTKLFEKHGMTNIGYWVPVENPESKLIYVLAFPSKEARDASWKAFMADPDWKKAYSESEKEGKLTAKIESVFMKATDYSPEIKPAAIKGDQVVELRTYTTTPGNLPALDARFRDHTTKLFAKHGMTNLAYWHLQPGQPAADVTLIYLLAHDSAQAAKASFAAFRANPDWIAAKEASEKKAGGSLTVPEGVKSVMMKPTDYSPVR